MDDISLCFSKPKRLMKHMRVEACHCYYKGLLGDVTDAIGLTDYSGAEKAQSQAMAAQASATDQSLQIARENIEFQREVFQYQQTQYEDWKNTFGDLSENLGEYYKNLTASDKIVQGLQAESKESQRAQQQLSRDLSQRGISGGGLEAQTLTAMQAQSAQTRAGIRASAEDQVKAQQLGFLGLGLGQGTQYLGLNTQQAGTIGSAYTSAAGNVLQGGIAQGQIGSAYAQQNLAGSYGNTQGLMDAAGNILGGMASAGIFSDIRLKKNIVKTKTFNGINIYKWEWNDIAKELGVSNQPTVGVIAQEILEIYPEVIKEDRGYYTVNYPKLLEVISEQE